MPNREMTIDLVNRLKTVVEKMEKDLPGLNDSVILLLKIEYNLKRLAITGRNPPRTCCGCSRDVETRGHVENCLVGQGLADIQHWKGIIDLGGKNWH